MTEADITFPADKLRDDMLVLPDLIVYHTNCHDGFASAWVASSFVAGIACYGVTHNKDTHEGMVRACEGKRVLMADFSPEADILDRCAEAADALVVLDHHKSQLDLVSDDRPYFLLDLGRSGARLTWDYFTGFVTDDPLNPEEPMDLRCSECGFGFLVDEDDGVVSKARCPQSRDLNVLCKGKLKKWTRQGVQVHSVHSPPWVVSYVEDRDLWNWALKDSHEVNAALGLLDYKFPEWDKMFKLGKAKAKEAGKLLKVQETKLVKAAAADAMTISLFGYPNVQVVSVPGKLVSATGNYLCAQDPTVPFAVMYNHHEPDGLKLSLRAVEGSDPLRCNDCASAPRRDDYTEPGEYPAPDTDCKVCGEGKLVVWPPDLGALAKKHWGGGGHPLAAGALVKNVQLPWFLETKLEALSDA
jgi:hypothetical protein